MKKLYYVLSTLLPTILLAELNPPTDLSFEDIRSNSVVLKWKDNSKSETGYKIYKGDELLFVAGKNVTSFKDINLAPNHTYKYTIKATDDVPFWSAINSKKDTFTTDDTTLAFDLFNLNGAQKDWVGVFKVGATLNRNNLLGWSYINTKEHTNIEINNIYTNGGHLSIGEYQAVLFYNDSYKAENRTYFDVKDRVYGKKGDFVVKRYNGDNYNVYHSEDVLDAPVVIFLSGYTQKIRDYVALMEFIASQGYYVIGLSDSYYAKDNVNLLNLLKDAKKREYADTSRVSVVGHSLGGAYSFHAMRAIKKSGYAQKRDSIIELDGWFALEMTADDMKKLDTTALIIQYGGVGSKEYITKNGVREIGNFQDPKINLAVYYMLQQNKKALRVINGGNSHGYQRGGLADYDEFLKKRDLLDPVHAFLEYTLKDDLNAKDIALRDDYKGVEDYVKTDDLTYDSGCLYYKNNINNYCDLNHILANEKWWDR